MKMRQTIVYTYAKPGEIPNQNVAVVSYEKGEALIKPFFFMNRILSSAEHFVHIKIRNSETLKVQTIPMFDESVLDITLCREQFNAAATEAFMYHKLIYDRKAMSALKRAFNSTGEKLPRVRFIANFLGQGHLKNALNMYNALERRLRNISH